METSVRSATQEIIIGYDRPTVLIGERINPTGKSRLTEALKEGDLPKALKPALETYTGKAIVNSVTGEEESLETILPLVKEHGAAVIGLTMNKEGIPKQAEKRLEIAARIVERAEAGGIPRKDVIIDCLALTVGADYRAALDTIEGVRRVREQLGVNQTLGASNISYGLPNRHVVNHAFLAIAIEAGVTCPTVNAEKVKQTVLATDLLLGQDRFIMRFIRDHQVRSKGKCGPLK
ncbi:MAG: dihydropteroate synthase [Pseudomonadota bacterium]